MLVPRFSAVMRKGRSRLSWDTNVIMLLSNPGLDAKTITSPVETSQVAPTILQALGFAPDDLQAVRKEGTQVLPSLFTEADEQH